MSDDKRRPIDRIELPPGINRDELGADIEGIRSLLRTRYELQSHARRQHIARTIAKAEKLAEMIVGDKVAPEARLGIQYLRHRQKVLSLIEDLEKDASPAVATLVGIDRGLSPFENAIEMIADRYRHFFDKEPGYQTNVYSELVDGPFIRFAEAMLEELQIFNEDGSPYRSTSIKAALKKLKRLRA
jgi:hypothetical protein